MRVSKEQFQKNREKIMAAAARLFRERGYEAVSVADVMNAAGLTHGGFYGHFKSKEDLFVQATGAASGVVLDRWQAMVEAKGQQALEAIAGAYLSEEHRKGVGGGCLIAALGPEIARQPKGARTAVTDSVKKIVETLEQGAPGSTEAERRRYALAAYSRWIGALVLARVSEDEAFSKAVMAAAAEG